MESREEGLAEGREGQREGQAPSVTQIHDFSSVIF